MLDIVAKLLSSIATFLFPVFASYKALKGNDPAQLTPWLMYWVVLACALLVESWTDWILVWFPFYAWIRAFTLLYLVLPQTQGARMLYQSYIHPFLSEHESEIDNFISSAHDRARAAGLQYLKQAIEFVKVNVLGLQPKQPSPPPSSHGTSYAQSLLASFNLPSRREGFTAPGAGDFYSLLSAAVGAATSSNTTREVQAEKLSASGTLIPPNIHSNAERMSYIATQRERLGVLLQALDKEASNLSTSPTSPARAAASAAPFTLPVMKFGSEDVSGSPLKKTRSDAEFERVEKEDIDETNKAAGGSWAPWSWGAKPGAAGGAGKGERAMAVSSGVDATPGT